MEFVPNSVVRVQMSLRTTPETKAAITAAAKRAGKPVGDYLVDRALSDDNQSSAERSYILSALRWMAAKKPLGAGPLWHQVAHIFGIGSTTAARICESYGFNSDTGEESK